MIRPITLATWLCLSLVTEVAAQTFDGVYRGARTMTEVISAGQGKVDCPAVGARNTIEVRVTGTSIVLTMVESGEAFEGTIAADGAFRISASVLTVGMGVSVTWTGTIQGNRLRGKMAGDGRGGGSCSGVLEARK